MRGRRVPMPGVIELGINGDGKGFRQQLERGVVSYRGTAVLRVDTGRTELIVRKDGATYKMDGVGRELTNGRLRHETKARGVLNDLGLREEE